MRDGSGRSHHFAVEVIERPHSQVFLQVEENKSQTMKYLTMIVRHVLWGLKYAVYTVN